MSSSERKVKMTSSTTGTTSWPCVIHCKSLQSHGQGHMACLGQRSALTTTKDKRFSLTPHQSHSDGCLAKMWSSRRFPPRTATWSRPQRVGRRWRLCNPLQVTTRNAGRLPVKACPQPSGRFQHRPRLAVAPQPRARRTLLVSQLLRRCHHRRMPSHRLPAQARAAAATHRAPALLHQRGPLPLQRKQRRPPVAAAELPEMVLAKARMPRSKAAVEATIRTISHRTTCRSRSIPSTQKGKVPRHSSGMKCTSAQRLLGRR